VGLRLRGAAVLLLLAAGLVQAEALTTLAEEELFAAPIVYTRSTPYQRIVVTQDRAGFQLFLSGHLQCSSTDEYRYHEALVHPAMLLAGSPRRVLILGGGDGLALREVLRHGSVEHVTLVDIDPEMTRLWERFPPLGELNGHAFADPRVTVVNRDAMIWLEASGPPFDAAVVDFPDPNSYSLGKLYTRRFYRLLRRRLTPDAAVAVQSTSPLAARASFWCIVRTLESAGFAVRPYHAAVPSFGVWGFCLARAEPFDVPAGELPAGLRFLTPQTLAALFALPPDLGPVPVEVNRLDNQCLVRYYDAEWKRAE
jgi:spermidine synthase